MELSLSAVGVERLARALDCIANHSLATALWRSDCAQAVGLLTDCQRASMTVVTPAMRGLAAPPSRLAPESLERRRRTAGLWARGPIGQGEGCTAIGITARTAVSDTVVSIVCEYDTPLSPDEARRRLAPLEVVFPVFNSMVARRFGPGGDESGTHPLLSPSVRQLLDALPDGVACLDDDGNMLWRNHALDRLLASDEEAERVRRELATAAQGLAIRAWGHRQGLPEEEDMEFVGGELRTQRSRYFMQLLRADDGADGLVVAIVARLGIAPTDEVIDTLRARYRLTKREAEVARLLLQGRSNVEVAQRLGISHHTARHHTERLLAKMGIESRNDIYFLVTSRRSGEMRIPSRSSREL